MLNPNPKTSKPSGLAIRELPDGHSLDGCEGGTLYFLMDGKEMALIVREKKKFYDAEQDGISLQKYANTTPSDLACKATEALEQLIPHVKRW